MTQPPETFAVVGRWTPPGAGRKLHLVLVIDCPHCGWNHAHYSGGTRLFGHSATRRCPRTGNSYLLLVTDNLVPAVVA